MKRVLTIYITILMLLMCGCSSSEHTKEHTGEVHESSPTPTTLQSDSPTPTKGEEDKVEIKTEYEIYLAVTEGEDSHTRIDYNTAELQVYREDPLKISFDGNKNNIKWTIEGRELEFEHTQTLEISGNRYVVDFYYNAEAGIILSFYENTTVLQSLSFMYGDGYTLGKNVGSKDELVEFADHMMEKIQAPIEGLDRSIRTDWNGERYEGFCVPTDCDAEDIWYTVSYEVCIDGIRTANSPYVMISGNGSLYIASRGNSDTFLKYTDVTLDHSQVEALIDDTMKTMCNTNEYVLNTYTTSKLFRVVEGKLFLNVYVKPTLEVKETGDKIEPEGLTFLIPLE